MKFCFSRLKSQNSTNNTFNRPTNILHRFLFIYLFCLHTLRTIYTGANRVVTCFHWSLNRQLMNTHNARWPICSSIIVFAFFKNCLVQFYIVPTKYRKKWVQSMYWIGIPTYWRAMWKDEKQYGNVDLVESIIFQSDTEHLIRNNNCFFIWHQMRH